MILALYKYYGRMIWGIVMMMLLNSCFFTSSVLKQSATEEYITPKEVVIKSASFENGLLNINYSSKGKDNKKDSLFSINIPVDTLMKLYKASGDNVFYYEAQVRNQQKGIRAYKVPKGSNEFNLYGNGVVIDMDRSAITLGQRELAGTNTLTKVELVIADSLFKPDLSEGKKKSLKLMYHVDDQPFNYVVFTIEYKKRSHSKKLLYLPLGIVGDVVTFPLQLFFVIFKDKANRPAFFEFPNRITAGN